MKKSKKVFYFVLIILICVIVVIILVNKKESANIINDDIQILDNLYENIDFSTVDILTIEELRALNPDNSTEFEYNSAGHLSRIKGPCANFKVNNSDDALKVLYGLQEILAVCDIADLRVLNEYHDKYDDIYTFRQNINGIEVNSFIYDIPVHSGNVSVIVDANTKDVYYVNSYCIFDFDADASNIISQNEAIEIVINKKDFNVNEITNIELIIYNDIYEGNVLTWYIETDSYDAPTIYLDANTGEILYYDVPRSY